MNRSSFVRVLTAFAGLVALACTAGAGAATARSVWDGVYSDAQAARGERLYAEHCVECHAEGMRGASGSPPLVGPPFMFNWDGETLGALYDQVRATMPPGQVGLLSDDEMIDALAAILKANAFPAAQSGAELRPDADALGAIAIARTAPSD
jgi:mono/diheme cytochrome c family protein